MPGEPLGSLNGSNVPLLPDLALLERPTRNQGRLRQHGVHRVPGGRRGPRLHLDQIGVRPRRPHPGVRPGPPRRLGRRICRVQQRSPRGRRRAGPLHVHLYRRVFRPDWKWQGLEPVSHRFRSDSAGKGAKRYLTDTDIEYIMEAVRPKLKDEKYDDAVASLTHLIGRCLALLLLPCMRHSGPPCPATRWGALSPRLVLEKGVRWHPAPIDAWRGYPHCITSCCAFEF